MVQRTSAAVRRYSIRLFIRLPPDSRRYEAMNEIRLRISFLLPPMPACLPEGQMGEARRKMKQGGSVIDGGIFPEKRQNCCVAGDFPVAYHLLSGPARPWDGTSKNQENTEKSAAYQILMLIMMKLVEQNTAYLVF